MIQSEQTVQTSSEPKLGEMTILLWVNDRPCRRFHVPLRSFIVGSTEDCDICLRGNAIDNYCCEVIRGENGAAIRSLSQYAEFRGNRPFVDAWLEEGDRVRFGNVVLEFTDLGNVPVRNEVDAEAELQRLCDEFTEERSRWEQRQTDLEAKLAQSNDCLKNIRERLTQLLGVDPQEAFGMTIEEESATEPTTELPKATSFKRPQPNPIVEVKITEPEVCQPSESAHQPTSCEATETSQTCETCQERELESLATSTEMEASYFDESQVAEFEDPFESANKELTEEDPQTLHDDFPSSVVCEEEVLETEEACESPIERAASLLDELHIPTEVAEEDEVFVVETETESEAELQSETELENVFADTESNEDDARLESIMESMRENLEHDPFDVQGSAAEVEKEELESSSSQSLEEAMSRILEIQENGSDQAQCQTEESDEILDYCQSLSSDESLKSKDTTLEFESTETEFADNGMDTQLEEESPLSSNLDSLEESDALESPDSEDEFTYKGLEAYTENETETCEEDNTSCEVFETATSNEKADSTEPKSQEASDFESPIGLSTDYSAMMAMMSSEEEVEDLKEETKEEPKETESRESLKKPSMLEKTFGQAVESLRETMKPVDSSTKKSIAKSNENLSSFRELANSSSNDAIASAKKKKSSTMAMVNLFLATICFAAAVIQTSLASELLSRSTIFSIPCYTGAFFFIWRYISWERLSTTEAKKQKEKSEKAKQSQEPEAAQVPEAPVAE